MKDIQFNLQKWQTGEYDVFTRDGKEVTKLTRFETARSAFRLAGVVEEIILKWMENGCCYQNSINPKGNDLFLRPKVKTRWYNVFEGNDGVHFINVNAFNTKEEAIKVGMGLPNPTYIKTIPVTNERE